MPNARTLEEAEKQIAALIEENKRLAAELEGTQTTGATLEKATREALAAKNSAEKEAAGAKAQSETLQKQVVDLRQTNATLTAQVARLNRQVEKSPLNPLTVEEASALFERIVAPFRASPTLELRDVSLTLKLASGKIGDVPVILVPDPKSADPALLHEITLDLTSRADVKNVAVPVRPVSPGIEVRPPAPRPIAGKARVRSKPK